MLIPNHNNKDCKLGYNGDCCCNCKYRYANIVNGVPIGYVCRNPIEDMGITKLNGIGGHSICECHYRIDC